MDTPVHRSVKEAALLSLVCRRKVQRRFALSIVLANRVWVTRERSHLDFHIRKRWQAGKDGVPRVGKMYFNGLSG
jgi:hypothetical protein